MTLAKMKIESLSLRSLCEGNSSLEKQFYFITGMANSAMPVFYALNI